MPRLLVGLCAGSALVAFACNDELVETVPKDVCYSEMRWIGGKRGSPEMYPGEDCVGCHLENDGPQLALGGTLYPYVIVQNDVLAAAQSGVNCFGVEGITVTIEDDEGQSFEVVTNRAGNFYVEGNPDDFAKPFTVSIEGYQKNADGTLSGQRAQMFTRPSYGGCAHCHNPNAAPLDPEVDPMDMGDPDYRAIVTSIGLPGYAPDGLGTTTVQAELEAIACEKSGLACPD